MRRAGTPVVKLAANGQNSTFKNGRGADGEAFNASCSDLDHFSAYSDVGVSGIGFDAADGRDIDDTALPYRGHFCVLVFFGTFTVVDLAAE